MPSHGGDQRLAWTPAAVASRLQRRRPVRCMRHDHEYATEVYDDPDKRHDWRNYVSVHTLNGYESSTDGTVRACGIHDMPSASGHTNTAPSPPGSHSAVPDSGYPQPGGPPPPLRQSSTSCACGSRQHIQSIYTAALQCMCYHPTTRWRMGDCCVCESTQQATNRFLVCE